MTMETLNAGASRTLSAMFDTRAEADRAVEALRVAGIADVVLHGEDNTGYGTVDRTEARHDDRGFFEAIGDFFFPDEDRYAYAEGLNRGGYLVTVSNLSDAQYGTALDILDDEGAVDLDAREAEWHEEGWTGYDAAPAAYGDAALTGDDRALRADRLEDDRLKDDRLEGDLNADGHIDVVEERLMVVKRQTEGGRVRVRSYVTETPVEEQVELRSERVNVERRAVDRPAGDSDFAERSIEAREYSETPVVKKEARVVEEIDVTTDVDTRVETVRDSVRRTDVEIEDDRGVIRSDDPLIDRR